MPVFRSPPRLAEVDRTLRRRPDGEAVVAIRLTDRPFAAVQSDVIAGVVAVNGLEGGEAGRFRRAAWSALDGTAPPSREVIDLRDDAGHESDPSSGAPNVGVA